MRTAQEIDRLKEKLAKKEQTRETLQTESLKLQDRRNKMTLTGEAIALEFLMRVCDDKADELTQEIEILKGQIYFNL